MTKPETKRVIDIEISGRKYRSEMYPIEYAFGIRDELLAPLGQVVAAGLTAQVDVSQGALELFTGASARAALKGGSFEVYKRVLEHSTRVEVGEAGEVSIPIIWADFAGDLMGVERLVWAVLRHNFESYFLELKALVKGQLDPKKAPPWLKMAMGMEMSSDSPATPPPATA